MRLIGDMVRSLRTAHGLTQPQVAEVAGCARSQVSELETGFERAAEKSITVRQLDRIVEAIGGTLVVSIVPRRTALQIVDAAVLAKIAGLLAIADDDSKSDFLGAVRSLERGVMAPRG